METKLCPGMGERRSSRRKIPRQGPSRLGIHQPRPLEEEDDLEARVDQGVEERGEARVGYREETGMERRMEADLEDGEETGLGD